MPNLDNTTKRESTQHLTDKEIEIILAPFIGNVKARSTKVLNLLDLRFLYKVTKKQIDNHTVLKALDPKVLINNTLIFNLTDSMLRTPKDINEKILLGVMENKSFLGIKKGK